jgi:hypothetical protein|tara:strand:- start:191 stop:1009 length:819 start_codon:yes stop_codon:yes gene_type:complete
MTVKKLTYILLILSLASFLNACLNKVDSNKKSNIFNEEYYESGNLKLIKYSKTGKKIDSTISYYDVASENKKSTKIILNDSLVSETIYHSNNKINLKGLLSNNQRVGIWKGYDNKGNSTDDFYYVLVDSKEYLNQHIKFDFKGDTIRKESTFFNVFSEKDSIKKNEQIKIYVYLNEPFFSYNSECKVYIPKFNLSDFNSSFDNFEKVEIDTIESFNNDGINRKLPKDFPSNRYFAFGVEFSKSGKKILRGYIEEFNKGKSRLMFFNKELFVE